MGRSNGKYGSYRGRRTATDLLRWTAIALGVLVALVLAGLMLGQNYIVYTDGGLRLDLPFFQREEEPLPDPGEVEVVVAPKEEEPAPQPPEQTAAKMLIAVTLESVLDGSAAGLAEQAGADGVVLDMKTDQGSLQWYSQQPMAQSAGANVQAEQVNSQLQAFHQTGVYTVARLSCFRDEAVGRDMAHTLMTQSGYRWKDGEQLHWSLPADEAVQDYLAALAAELAQLGFDEIVLDHCGYPGAQDGLLGNISQGEGYRAQQRPQVLDQFLQKMRTALAPYQVKLSVVATQAAAAGEDGDSGQSAALLDARADRIWMDRPADGVDPVQLLTGAGVQQAGERLVLMQEQLDGQLPTAQAAMGQPATK